MSRKLPQMNYDILKAKYDLKRLFVDFETYTEMMIELEVIRREAGHTGMHEEKANNVYKDIQKRYDAINNYLGIIQEITEAQVLLYVTSRKSDD